MSKENRQNDVNQNGAREHEHPHGQSLPHQPLSSVNPRENPKRQGKAGQPNFIPGGAPVGEPGRVNPSRKPAK